MMIYAQTHGSKIQQFSFSISERIKRHQATTMHLKPDLAHGHACVTYVRALAGWHQCTERRRPGCCHSLRDCSHQHLWVVRDSFWSLARNEWLNMNPVTGVRFCAEGLHEGCGWLFAGLTGGAGVSPCGPLHVGALFSGLWKHAMRSLLTEAMLRLT